MSRLASLSPTERALLCTSAILLLASRALLAVSGVTRTRRVIRRLAAILPPFQTVRDPDDIPWAVRSTATYLPGSYSCLPQAIVGEALLAASGYPVTVRIGVSKREEGFGAHAWVEHDGTVVLGNLDDLDRFRPITDWRVEP